MTYELCTSSKAVTLSPHGHVRLKPICDSCVKDTTFILFKEQTLLESTMQKVSTIFVDMHIKNNKVHQRPFEPITCD